MKEQIHKELASLQEELSRLDNAVKHIEEAKNLAEKVTSNGRNLEEKYKEQLKEVEELTKQYQELTIRTEKLIEQIDKVDFPSRLDKIDSTITTVNQGLQNTQGKLEIVGKELKEEIKKGTSNLTESVKENQKEIKLIKILLIASIALSIGILITLFMK